MRLGYVCSYATGSWGVGSDLDLVAVVRSSDRRFEQRALDWDLTALPVPAEILIYVEAEWSTFTQNDRRFSRMLQRDVVWVLGE